MLLQGLSSGHLEITQPVRSQRDIFKAVLPLLGVPADEHPMSLPGSADPWIHTSSLLAISGNLIQ